MYLYFRFWEYNSARRIVSSGNITEYGLPLDLAEMDAAFKWQRNGKTFFFKGSKYWKYDDGNRQIDVYYYDRTYRKYRKYPRNIQPVWRFAGNIKAAVKWRNERNYVFWDSQYIKLRKGRVLTEIGYPQEIADRWMKCKSKGRELGSLDSEP